MCSRIAPISLHFAIKAAIYRVAGPQTTARKHTAPGHNIGADDATIRNMARVVLERCRFRVCASSVLLPTTTRHWRAYRSQVCIAARI